MHGDAAYALAHTRLVGGPRGGRLFGRWYTDAGVGSSLVLQLEKAVKGDAVVSPMVVVERGGGATQRWQVRRGEAALKEGQTEGRRVLEADIRWGEGGKGL